MKQVERTVDTFESKYPFARALFLFDNTPSRRKMADNLLNADVKNVYPGEKQPLMRDTEWAGEIQTMALSDGQAKGMKLQKEYIEMRGHLCLYIPKYNCEFKSDRKILVLCQKTYSSICGRKDHKATKNCS